MNQAPMPQRHRGELYTETMSEKSRELAHELFYPGEYGRERSDGNRFRVERKRDYCIAYSYRTPIAVYGDGQDYMLLNSSHYSTTTSEHQYGLRQAVPYHIRCIELPWPDVRDCHWGSQAFSDGYAGVLKHIITIMQQEVKPKLGEAGTIAYANERNQYRKTCRELKELLKRTQQLAGFQGQLERWLTRAEDKEYIRTQQKLVRVEDHNRKARSEARQKRSNAYDELVKFFVRHPDLWKMVTEVTWELLQSHSLIYLLNAVKLYRDSSLAPGYGQGDTLPQALLLALERLIKIRLSDIRAYACARDDVWYSPEDDHYHTTRQVRISTPELQQALELWKRGRILGTRVSGKYPVVENTEEYVTIGCHRFARETVESIYRRYAGRTEHEMHRQEPALHHSCADRIARLVNLALAELGPIVRRQPWYRDLHAKAKLLKPA